MKPLETEKMSETTEQNEAAQQRVPHERAVSEWTQDEVMRFALEGNHAALYRFCQLHRYNPHMWTWEQVMQAAAVEMAKQLDETKKMLIDAAMQSPVMPVLARIDCGTKVKRKSTR